ncbi:MAG: UTP--glucose-1-phosphate uridylyltransferase [Puniceicoccaceae bacterium]
MTTQEMEAIRSKFEKAGQGHVFRFISEVGADGAAKLFDQLDSFDPGEVAALYEELVRGSSEKTKDYSDLEPAPFIAHPDRGGDAELWKSAQARGLAAIRAGKLAAFTVAGGQGTRLGYDGPKGTFPVGPVTGATLFEVFGGKIAAMSRAHGVTIPWLVMTSPINHEATKAFFEKHDWFGLGEENVMLFPQGTMPAIDHDGRLLLSAKDSLSLSPDGHGGSLRALVRSGAIQMLEERGVTTISYFQVDNPLVKVIDPSFIGFHLEAGSEMSSKMIPKAFATEKVGNFCARGGKIEVVEYSDLPVELAEATGEDGTLRFVAGSIAIHLLETEFVKKMGSTRFPMHRADKKIAHLDESGTLVEPTEPNGIKFEMFVFDALPMAANPIVVETLRSIDFSPVKNATGVDSPETCRADQLREWTTWALAAGIEMAVDDSGLPLATFEVQPSYAYDLESFVNRARAEALKGISEGMVLR